MTTELAAIHDLVCSDNQARPDVVKNVALDLEAQPCVVQEPDRPEDKNQGHEGRPQRAWTRSCRLRSRVRCRNPLRSVPEGISVWRSMRWRRNPLRSSPISRTVLG